MRNSFGDYIINVDEELNSFCALPMDPEEEVDAHEAYLSATTV